MKFSTTEFLARWCIAQCGKPYVWSGQGPDQWDCSGLAQEFYKMYGIDPPGDQTAQGYYNHWSSKIDRGCWFIAKAKIAFGDMLFFGSDRSNITHIAIGINRFLLFEAGGGGRDCKTIEDARRLGASVRLRPIDTRRDFLCAIRPCFKMVD